MSIKNTEVTIKGLSPLLMHRFPLETIKAIEKKPKEEQAELSAYRVPDTDELYLPGIALQRALIAGAAYSKGKGRSSLIKPVAACLLINPEYILLGTKEYIIDSRAVVIPSTKGRIVRYRPRIDEWEATFTLEWDEDLVSCEQMRQVVDDTGTRVGLLDFRPACKGPFGRFIVNKWGE